MRIVRHCRERLPGGERLWRRMAREAAFVGEVRLYGYGRGGFWYKGGYPVLADHEPGLIRVWLAAPCATLALRGGGPYETPLAAYAHELGHHRQAAELRGSEPGAERFGRRLLRALSVALT